MQEARVTNHEWRCFEKFKKEQQKPFENGDALHEAVLRVLFEAVFDDDVKSKADE